MEQKSERIFENPSSGAMQKLEQLIQNLRLELAKKPVDASYEKILMEFMAMPDSKRIDVLKEVHKFKALVRVNFERFNESVGSLYCAFKIRWRDIEVVSQSPEERQRYFSPLFQAAALHHPLALCDVATCILLEDFFIQDTYVVEWALNCLKQLEKLAPENKQIKRWLENKLSETKKFLSISLENAEEYAAFVNQRGNHEVPDPFIQNSLMPLPLDALPSLDTLGETSNIEEEASRGITLS